MVTASKEAKEESSQLPCRMLRNLIKRNPQYNESPEKKTSELNLKEFIELAKHRLGREGWYLERQQFINGREVGERVAGSGRCVKIREAERKPGQRGPVQLWHGSPAALQVLGGLGLDSPDSHPAGMGVGYSQEPMGLCFLGPVLGPAPCLGMGGTGDRCPRRRSGGANMRGPEALVLLSQAWPRGTGDALAPFLSRLARGPGDREAFAEAEPGPPQAGSMLCGWGVQREPGGHWSPRPALACMWGSHSASPGGSGNPEGRGNFSSLRKAEIPESGPEVRTGSSLKGDWRLPRAGLADAGALYM